MRGRGLRDYKSQHAPLPRQLLAGRWFPQRSSLLPEVSTSKMGFYDPQRCHCLQLHAIRRRTWVSPRRPSPKSLRRSPPYPPHPQLQQAVLLHRGRALGCYGNDAAFSPNSCSGQRSPWQVPVPVPGSSLLLAVSVVRSGS